MMARLDRLAASVGNGLSGAAMLATGRPAGVARVDTNADGAIRSFWAAAITLPILLCLRLIDWTVYGVPGAPALDLARNLMVFVVGWAGFAVISHHLAQQMDRGERWPGYIAVWNWCNVIQYGLLLAAAMPVLLHAPAPISEAAELIALGWALWLEWFAARLTLGVGAWTAAALVGVDLGLGLLLTWIGGT
jgi:hypothetical protein